MPFRGNFLGLGGVYGGPGRAYDIEENQRRNIMSTKKTQNYQLHQWEATDDFLRTEFNENFGKLDEAA